MKLIISGSESRIEEVTFSEVGFGTQSRDDSKQFILIVPSQDFVDRFGPIYEECIVELIRDDQITGKFQPPFVGATRYPEFEEFFTMADSQRMEMIETYFLFDILRMYISEDVYDGDVQWDIRSLNSLQREGQDTFISGQVMRRG